MIKNNIILILALLIITITIFSTNLKDLTGRQVQSCTENDLRCNQDILEICTTETWTTQTDCTDQNEICDTNTLTCITPPDCDIKCQLQTRFCYLKELIGEITDNDYQDFCE